jgi:hypothetical protein
VRGNAKTGMINRTNDEVRDEHSASRSSGTGPVPRNSCPRRSDLSASSFLSSVAPAFSLADTSSSHYNVQDTNLNGTSKTMAVAFVTRNSLSIMFSAAEIMSILSVAM